MPSMRKSSARQHQVRSSPLTVSQILAWADAHYRRTGRWPTNTSGQVIGAPGETWDAIRGALGRGNRGLPGGSSVAKVLSEHRGLPYDVRFVRGRRLTVQRILQWARAHRRQTGLWPSTHSGPVHGVHGETWGGIQSALHSGMRGLKGGSSLAKLLNKHRRPGPRQFRPSLTHAQILRWADAHHRRTGRWPMSTSGAITGAAGETWQAVNAALRYGGRGLTGGVSLSRLLAIKRGARYTWPKRTPLSIRRVLMWAEAHRRETGDWPSKESGPIPGSRHETWSRINSAFARGGRDLPARMTLAKILARYRGKRNKKDLPKLTHARILSWADAYYRRHRKWPNAKSGPIREAPGEKWSAVCNAMHVGLRGLPQRKSLSALLTERRGARIHQHEPRLTEAKILQWARAHHERTGEWPKSVRGALPDAHGESWREIDVSLKRGLRGLPGGKSLGLLMLKHFGVRWVGALPKLSVRQIRSWARSYCRRTGFRPTQQAGPVAEAPGETWAGINYSLVKGRRDLPKGFTLSRLLSDMRPATWGERSKPALRLDRIVLWARAHARRTGEWPTRYSGRVDDAPGEVWFAIDNALAKGSRSVPRIGSLQKLLGIQTLPKRVELLAGRRKLPSSKW